MKARLDVRGHGKQSLYLAKAKLAQFETLVVPPDLETCSRIHRRLRCTAHPRRKVAEILNEAIGFLVDERLKYQHHFSYWVICCKSDEPSLEISFGLACMVLLGMLKYLYARYQMLVVV